MEYSRGQHTPQNLTVFLGCLQIFCISPFEMQQKGILTPWLKFSFQVHRGQKICTKLFKGLIVHSFSLIYLSPSIYYVLSTQKGLNPLQKGTWTKLNSELWIGALNPSKVKQSSVQKGLTTNAWKLNHQGTTQTLHGNLVLDVKIIST